MPSDYNLINVRSYSINDLLNSGENWTGTNPYIRINQVKKPTSTFLFIEEFDPRGFNLGGFAAYKSGDSWVDFPASIFHGDGVNISFMDGRVEYWKYSDPRTAAINNFFASTPGDPDLYQLQAWLGL